MTGLRELIGDGDVCGDERPAVGRLSIRSCQARAALRVDQPEKTAPVGPGASDAVLRARGLRVSSSTAP